MCSFFIRFASRLALNQRNIPATCTDDLTCFNPNVRLRTTTAGTANFSFFHVNTL